MAMPSERQIPSYYGSIVSQTAAASTNWRAVEVEQKRRSTRLATSLSQVAAMVKF
jgi:hypothetical protein